MLLKPTGNVYLLNIRLEKQYNSHELVSLRHVMYFTMRENIKGI